MAYYTRLKRLSETCKFADADREIKTQIILDCTSTKLRQKALNEPATTLQALLGYGKTIELTASQISAPENQQTEGVNEIKKHVGDRQKSRNGNGRNGRRESGMDSGNLEWTLGTKDHPDLDRATQNVETVVDHTHMRVARHAVLHIRRNVTTAVSLDISSWYAEVNQNRNAVADSEETWELSKKISATAMTKTPSE